MDFPGNHLLRSLEVPRSRITVHDSTLHVMCSKEIMRPPCGPRKDVAAFITFFLLKVVGTSLASLPDEKDVNESSTHHA